MSQPKVAQAILRIVQAIADGRFEAKEVAGMTEEQVDQLNERLAAELDAGIASDEEAIAERLREEGHEPIPRPEPDNS